MKRYLSILIALLCLTSCFEHKELCYTHSEHAHRYHVNIVADYRCDWEEHYGGPKWQEVWPENYIDYESLRPAKPEGLRVVVYDKEGNHMTHNIKPDGGVVSIYKDLNDLLFYNNDTEYIVFSTTSNDVTTRATTRATTRSRMRSTYLGSEFANEGEQTLTAPDMLYANYYTDHLAEKVVEPVDLPVTLQPLVFTYKVRYEFESGLEYVMRARGALTGMASSVLLNTGETSSEPATLLYDCDMTDFGARARVNSFGIPSFPNQHYPTRTENKHSLNLEVLLKNGKTVNFNWDVTDQVSQQPHGGVIVIDGIVIEEEDGMEGSGAFDVTVNDWGEYEDIIIPL